MGTLPIIKKIPEINKDLGRQIVGLDPEDNRSKFHPSLVHIHTR
jgi:hypothetical protein